jgi:hypothetical protein
LRGGLVGVESGFAVSAPSERDAVDPESDAALEPLSPESDGPSA